MAKLTVGWARVERPDGTVMFERASVSCRAARCVARRAAQSMELVGAIEVVPVGLDRWELRAPDGQVWVVVKLPCGCGGGR